MFADPQSVTVNAVANSLPRTSSGQNAGEFTSSDGALKLLVSHSYGKARTRRVARLDHKKISPDPLFPAQNTPYTLGVYIVVDEPSVGYTLTEKGYYVRALSDWLTASSNANTVKLNGGES